MSLSDEQMMGISFVPPLKAEIFFHVRVPSLSPLLEGEKLLQRKSTRPLWIW